MLSDDAVLKDWRASPIRPLLRDAKQHFRPDAVPMVGERYLVFSV